MIDECYMGRRLAKYTDQKKTRRKPKNNGEFLMKQVRHQKETVREKNELQN